MFPFYSSLGFHMHLLPNPLHPLLSSLCVPTEQHCGFRIIVNISLQTEWKSLKCDQNGLLPHMQGTVAGGSEYVQETGRKNSGLEKERNFSISSKREIGQTGSSKLPGGFLGTVRDHKGHGARLCAALSSTAKQSHTGFSAAFSKHASI